MTRPVAVGACAFRDYRSRLVARAVPRAPRGLRPASGARGTARQAHDGESRQRSPGGTPLGATAAPEAALPAGPSATSPRPTPGPAPPSARRSSASPSRVTIRSAASSGRAAPDDPPRLPVKHRVRRAPGVTRDHRKAGRGGLQVDDAEPLDIKAAAPGPARHGEDVARPVVRGEFLPRHRPGEADGLGRRPSRRRACAAPSRKGRLRPSGEPLQAPEPESAAWRGSACPVPCAARAARRTPRPAGRVRPRPGAYGVAARARVEGLLVDAGRQLDHPPRRGGRQRGGDPGAGVLTEIGDRVRRLADTAQELPGRGQLRPARLVPVRRRDEPLAPPPCAARAP